MKNVAYFSTDNDGYEHTKLKEWLSSFHTDDELRQLFIHMDRAMKYIHDRGYCIQSFNTNDIEILNDSLKYIKFNLLFEMPNNFDDRKELIHEDIYSLAFLQIGIYTKCLDYLKPQFLKDNFNSFATFLPEDDVAYYRGIVERGASVYFYDYVNERKKRVLESLEGEINGGDANSANKGKSLVKTNGMGIDFDNNNDQINASIYGQLFSKDAAFISSFAFPAVVLLIGIVVVVLAYLFSLS